MDKKLLSTVIIIAVIIASMGAVIVYDHNIHKDTDSSGSTYNVIARVNSEGSGIYIKESVLSAKGGASEFYDTTTYDVTGKGAAWGGLIFGTPGAATIQHIQLQSMVEKMGLTFTLYQSGMATDSSHVYYVLNIANKTAAVADPNINGGIVWEPQFSAIVDDTSNDYVSLGLTNDFFSGHTCCIIAGYSSYMQTHADQTNRFLAAYIKGVEWVLDPANHDALVALGKDKTGITDDAVINDSLDHITYLYDDVSDDLSQLRKDIAELSQDLPALKHTVQDLGFANAYQFASRFVDDSYMMSAIDIHNDTSYSYSGPKSSIKVACIAGDIHQIALHAAVAQGFFDEYGLIVTVSAATNGPGVATALQNGEAQFGLMGAPPATSTAINGMLVTY